MKVVTEAVPVIKLVPRFYPDSLDTIVMVLDNGEVREMEWTTQKNLIIVTLESTEGLIQGTTYSFSLKRNSEIVYKGKFIFVANDTDIQNYTNQSQNTKRWK